MRAHNKCCDTRRSETFHSEAPSTSAISRVVLIARACTQHNRESISTNMHLFKRKIQRFDTTSKDETSCRSTTPVIGPDRLSYMPKNNEVCLWLLISRVGTTLLLPARRSKSPCSAPIRASQERNRHRARTKLSCVASDTP